MTLTLRDLIFSYKNRYRTLLLAKSDPHLRHVQRRIDELHRVAMRRLLEAGCTRAEIRDIRRQVQGETQHV